MTATVLTLRRAIRVEVGVGIRQLTLLLLLLWRLGLG